MTRKTHHQASLLGAQYTLKQLDMFYTSAHRLAPPDWIETYNEAARFISSEVRSIPESITAAKNRQWLFAGVPDPVGIGVSRHSIDLNDPISHLNAAVWLLSLEGYTHGLSANSDSSAALEDLIFDVCRHIQTLFNASTKDAGVPPNATRIMFSNEDLIELAKFCGVEIAFCGGGVDLQHGGALNAN